MAIHENGVEKSAPFLLLNTVGKKTLSIKRYFLPFKLAKESEAHKHGSALSLNLGPQI